MARCSNCDFNLAHHDDRASLEPGHCDSCNSPVCFTCGCTAERPCMRGGDYLDTCSWQQLVIGEVEPGQFSIAALETPGLCSFCYQATAERLYAEMNSFEQAGLVISAP